MHQHDSRLRSSSGSLCDCCLSYVLEDVLGIAPDYLQKMPDLDTDGQSSKYSARKEQARFVPWDHIFQLSDQIQKCCLRWGRLCCKSSSICCSKGRSRRQEGRAPTRTNPKKQDPLAPAPTSSSPLRVSSRLLVKRMDCADCAYKASRTLTQLPSVKVHHLDYFQGIIDVEHSPGT